MTPFLRFSVPAFLRLSGIPLRAPRDGGGGAPDPNVGKGALTDDQVRDIIRRDGRGDSHRAIRRLATDAAKARERARVAEEALALGKKDGLVPDGSVLLKADEAKAWTSVQKFLTDSKIDIEAMLKNAKAAPDLQAKVETQERKSTVADAADALEWDADVLGEVIETKGLEISVRPVKSKDENGKTVSEDVWHVRKKGEKDDAFVPLGEFADEHLKLFLPALVEGAPEASGAKGRGGERDTQRQGTRRDEGTRFVEQSRSKTPAPGGKSETELRQEALSQGHYGVI